VKRPGNADGIATAARDGRHMAKALLQPQPHTTTLQQHTMYVLAIMRLAQLLKDSSPSMSSLICIAQASSAMLWAWIWQAVTGKTTLILHLCLSAVYVLN